MVKSCWDCKKADGTWRNGGLRLCGSCAGKRSRAGEKYRVHKIEVVE